MLALVGWFLTEMGRQPWIVRGYMRMSRSSNTSRRNNLSLQFYWHLVYHFDVIHVHTY
ncbi:cytochrome ubiquinol oxidase subunit I [Staphylococcus aureus]